MTTHLETPRLTDDATLTAFLAQLLETAIRRQLWIFFLDEDGRIADPIMPNDDYPTDPSLPITTDDLGERTVAEVFGARFAHIVRTVDAAELVVVWEREGDDTIDVETRAWARAFGAALRDEGARVRAQLLLHSGGLRMIAPDDLM
ncbi:hypothetical protein [Microbacterium sp.]|uniref:hypothetical protein n=1 Tax=Microbacterium sp. TaxID=51671 RepID=UPI0039E6D928